MKFVRTEMDAKPPKLYKDPTDWMMPVMSGSEFVRQERARIEEIPVVVISAVAETLGPIPGVRERVGKPLGIVELLETVDRHVEPPSQENERREA
jgi:CheY-like chemotaxis protein